MTINNKLFRNPLIYTDDKGLTNTEQEIPIEVVDTDSSWMKAGAIEGQKEGRIVRASDFQKFIPYQAGYESEKKNNWGIVKQSDKQHPWVDYTENTWEDTINHPPNFKGNFDIEGWYANQVETSKEVYQWKTDIFGNQYGLYKDFGTTLQPSSLYNKKHAIGELWVNSAFNVVKKGVDALSGIFVNYAAINETAHGELTGNQIKDIDIFYDTLMITTSNFILLDKIQMDYTTGSISSITDYSHIIDLQNSSGYKFADTWFFEDTKKVVFCHVKLIDNIPIPYLYELDLDKNTFFLKFPNDNSDLSDLNQLESYSLSGIECPQFTYNSLTQTFNITLQATIGLSSSNLVLINISNQTLNYDITNVTLITPVDLSTPES